MVSVFVNIDGQIITILKYVYVYVSMEKMNLFEPVRAADARQRSRPMLDGE